MILREPLILLALLMSFGSLILALLAFFKKKSKPKK